MKAAWEQHQHHAQSDATTSQQIISPQPKRTTGVPWKLDASRGRGGSLLEQTIDYMIYNRFMLDTKWPPGVRGPFNQRQKEWACIYRNLRATVRYNIDNSVMKEREWNEQKMLKIVDHVAGLGYVTWQKAAVAHKRYEQDERDVRMIWGDSMFLYRVLRKQEKAAKEMSHMSMKVHHDP